MRLSSAVHFLMHVIGWAAGYMAIMTVAREMRDYVLWNRPVTVSRGDWWVVIRMLIVAVLLAVWQRLVFGS